MATVKVLVIDPAARTVRVERWDQKSFESIYKWIGTSLLDHCTRRLPDGRAACCWVDDIGLAKPHLNGWLWPSFYPQVLRGVGVMFGADESGETIDVPYSVNDAMASILWEDHVH